jgi:hypothetical protein
MEQSPYSEANSHLPSQEIHCRVWNPKIYYRVHKSPPLVLILSHMYPVHTFPPYFLEIRSNIILLFTHRSSEWSLPIRFYNRNIVDIPCLSHACYMSRQSHPVLDHRDNIL